MRRLAYLSMALVIGTPLILAGCNDSRSPEEKIAAAKAEAAEQERQEEAHRYEVTLRAIAPDGTKLWAWDPGPGHNFVYFSASGTQTDEQHGKHHDRVIVPNQETP